MEPNKTLGRLYLAGIRGINALDRICIDDVLNGNILPACLAKNTVEHLAQKRIPEHLWNSSELMDRARIEFDRYESARIHCVSFFDEWYPESLRETARPPYLLYVRGRPEALVGNCLTMVGTRYPTGLGLETAKNLAMEASRLGYTVVSGLARGIDTASHFGAVSERGTTVAVLGSGIDYVYPASNTRLAERMLECGGAIVSEYPALFKPGKYTFPERNRILAGMSRATLVVEAPEGSGALITADFALEEGREVCVSSLCLETSRSAGCRKLVKEGASPIACVRDILKQYAY